MTSVLLANDLPDLLPSLMTDEPDLSPSLGDDSGCTTGGTVGLETLLFGLSLATGLSPTALVLSPNAARPAVQTDPSIILSPTDLQVTLRRPTTEVGRGRVALGDVDQRMRCLAVSLVVFRVAHGSGVLVSLGVVTPSRPAGGDASATTADLWALACKTLPRHALVCELAVGLGDDARLVLHGGVTAQVVWLAGDRLVTVSVTGLDGDGAWLTDAARSIAVLLDRRLR